MTYTFTQDVPANAEMYAKIKALLPEHPAGMVLHLAYRRDAGLRYVDVWDDEASWIAFRDAHVEPAVGKVLASYGLPHDHSLVAFQEVDLVDAWLA